MNARLSTRIAEADRGRCRYCQTTERNSGIPLTFDHIHPSSKGGPTTFENVCQACGPCNRFKADAVDAIDPLSGERVRIFNPRTEAWSDHFVWSADSTKIVGLTPTGRATVVALRVNRPVIVTTRERWRQVGWHPPAA